jgi:tRNA(fMet)-specific endonuclease VapC
VKYLLDTNSWVFHIRQDPNSKVTANLTAAPPGSVYLGSVVLAELLYGVLLSSTAYHTANLTLVGMLQSQYPSVVFDHQAAHEYAKIRAHLKKMGTPIGPNDMLIAALALANGMTLVTHNTVEFSRVPGLILEDWY